MTNLSYANRTVLFLSLERRYDKNNAIINNILERKRARESKRERERRREGQSQRREKREMARMKTMQQFTIILNNNDDDNRDYLIILMLFITV